MTGNNIKDNILKSMEMILKGCENGLSEQQIPYFISSYEVNDISVRDSGYEFTCELQKKVCEHGRLGLIREIPVYSLILDRYVSLSELRGMLQESQDISNREGYNGYKGYMFVYIGDILEPSEVNKNNELFEFLLRNVFLKHRDIRAYMMVPERLTDKMKIFMSRELPVSVMCLSAVRDTDICKEDTGKDELYDLFKETAEKCGMKISASSDRFKTQLYEAVPDRMRNPGDISRIVCNAVFAGKSLSVENISDLANEVYKRDIKRADRGIGFRI